MNKSAPSRRFPRLFTLLYFINQYSVLLPSYFTTAARKKMPKNVIGKEFFAIREKNGKFWRFLLSLHKFDFGLSFP